MKEIDNSVPWIREINYAVSRFGHLVEENLDDTTLPDVAEEMDRARARAELGRIYRQLKPAMRQALLLSRIHKHPTAEQPVLLERFGLQSKLGLSDSGWDKRWSRTRNE